jgi:hypothetical protein
MTKIEELRAAHQYFEYLWFARDAGDTYSIGSGDDIIATSTSESLARFTVYAHNNMPALLEAVEALKELRELLAQAMDAHIYDDDCPYVAGLERADQILEELR